MTVCELDDLIRECREWENEIDDMRGYTRSGLPSKDYPPDVVAAAKGLYESPNYFGERRGIARYFQMIHDATTRATPEKSAEMEIVRYRGFIQEIRDEIYKDVRPLNNKLTRIGMSPTSPLRPTHFPESSADCMAKNSDVATSSHTVVTPSQSPAAERRARQVKQTLDDFESLLREEVYSRPRLAEWTKSNLESPIAKAYAKDPEETFRTCISIESACKNDRLAIEIVKLASKLKGGTIAKAWAQFRKVNGLND